MLALVCGPALSSLTLDREWIFKKRAIENSSHIGITLGGRAVILLHRLILSWSRLGCLVKHPELRNIDHLLVWGLDTNIYLAAVHKLSIAGANGLSSEVLSAIDEIFIGLALGGVTILPNVR